jgi:hypothetical protein
MASMPPPGVAGSKKARLKADPSLLSCASSAPRTGRDPAAAVKVAGEACAAAAKMKPSGPTLRGQQGDKDPHAEHRVRVESGKCYRVFLATEESAKDAVIVVRDSAGDVVATSEGGAAVPSDGTMCFTAGDELTLLVAVGSGRGAYVAQLWSD